MVFELFMLNLVKWTDAKEKIVFFVLENDFIERGDNPSFPSGNQE